MPTPIAHALGGIAAGCLAVSGSRLVLKRPVATCRFEAAVARIGHRRGVAALACLGMLPDVDLLLGMHRSVTHSLGAVLLVLVAASAITSTARLPVALTAAAAFASHVLLDWLGNDLSPPYGIMAWWPWAKDFYLSDTRLFLSVCREYWVLECWRHNSLALVRELAVLVPLAGTALLVARRSLGARKTAMGDTG